MTPFEPVVTSATGTHVLHVLRPTEVAAWLAERDRAIRQWLELHACTGEATGLWVFPDSAGALSALLVAADLEDPMSFAGAPLQIPAGAWRIETAGQALLPAVVQLGWRLGAYQFTRYKTPKRAPAQLVVDAIDETAADVAQACMRVRDWVNTPTEDMGPEELQTLAENLAVTHGGECSTIAGKDLLAENFPTIYAVGRASHRAPRLIHLRWGKAGARKLSLVGKGVCFDTGGLDMKAAAGMRNMKKDMGGSAHVLALAGLIMARNLPVQLDVYVAAVENAVGPEALRPGDIVTTRKGLRVEIDNTDAEGRLVLCDALAYACESAPELLIDFATLTGAARVALGPDLPPMYANQDALAEETLIASRETRDPMWRMPLWQPYTRYLDSKIADMANASPTPMAGSVTAALYLQKFVTPETPWMHLDVYAWNDADRPGKPAGGEAHALRAVFAMLATRFAAT